MNSSIGIDKRYKEMRGLAFHRVSQQEVLSLIDENIGVQGVQTR